MDTADIADTRREIEMLFLQIQPELQRHVRRIVRCAATAEDLTQDLFMRLDRVPNTLSSTNDRRRYLFRMASNLALDHQRVRANRARLLDEMGPFLIEDADANADTGTREQLELLQDILAGLPSRRRTIFEKSRLLGMTYSEIARELGVSVSLVEKEVAATMKTLLLAAAAASPGVAATAHEPAASAPMH